MLSFKDAKNTIPQIQTALNSCDFPNDFKEQKEAMVAELDQKCTEVEANLEQVLKQWNKMDEEVTELDSWLIRKNKELSKVPMTEAHFEKLHKILQVGNSISFTFKFSLKRYFALEIRFSIHQLHKLFSKGFHP